MIDNVSLLISLAQPGQAGRPFAEWLLDHEPKRATRDRVVVLLQQWDTQRDDLGREPTVREYSREWRVPEAVAYRQVSEFRRVFGADPGEVASLLWDAVAQQQGEHFGLVPLLGVKVAER